MEKWCSKANTSPADLKGLVVHNFEFQKFLCGKLDEGKLCKELEIKNFWSNSEPIVIVYNPTQSVISLMRKSRVKNLREEMEFCSDNMKMFLLLFGDECKKSRAKVFCLLAINETAYELYETFLPWMSERSKDFNITNTESINEDNIIAFSEKLIGCLAAAPYFENIATFTTVPKGQMKHVLMLLTPTQRDIIHSD